MPRASSPDCVTNLRAVYACSCHGLQRALYYRRSWRKYTRDYPDVVLDITADDSRMDIVAGHYDAAIQYGEFIQKDMIAVRVSGDHRAAIDGIGVAFMSEDRVRIIWRAVRLSVCWKIGASRSPVFSFITRAGSSNRPRCRR
jgi:hypothetical protein